MSDRAFKYDVAFSLLSTDEPLAERLNGLLSDRLSTFLYSRKQEELPGRDGELLFNSVFGTDSRIVVVLCRPQWGETPWTRIESTAIRNRGFAKGYDFVLMIPLEGEPPEWLPKSQLWLDLDRLGEKGAAAVVEARVKERGGLVRSETAEEDLERLSRELAAEDRRQLLLLQEGPERARADIARLFDTIEAMAKKNPMFATERRGSNDFVLSAMKHSIGLNWSCDSLNFLRDGRLSMTLWQGVIRMGASVRIRDPVDLGTRAFSYDLTAEGHGLWREDDGNMFTGDTLADLCVRILADQIRKAANL